MAGCLFVPCTCTVRTKAKDLCSEHFWFLLRPKRVLRLQSPGDQPPFEFNRIVASKSVQHDTRNFSNEFWFWNSLQMLETCVIVVTPLSDGRFLQS